MCVIIVGDCFARCAAHEGTVIVIRVKQLIADDLYNKKWTLSFLIITEHEGLVIQYQFSSLIHNEP